MTVAASWRDNRIDTLINVAVASLGSQVNDVNNDLNSCASKLPVVNYSSTNLSNCQNAMSALSKWKSSCNKPCYYGELYLCCDLVWLPNLNFDNLVSLSQDRPVEDIIYLISGNSSIYGKTPDINGGSGVIRSVQVQATFSAGYLFQDFPFDEQKLVVKIILGFTESDINLISSGISRNSSGLFIHRKSKSDELPSWAVKNINMTCNPFVTTVNDVPLFTEKPLDPRDILVDVTNAGSSAVANIATSCDLIIEIKRLSAYYIWNTLFPLVCIVHVAFLPLFVSPHKLDLRMTTVVTLFLALTALQFTTNAELPSSSYLTAYHKLVLVSYSLLVLLAVEYLLAYSMCTWKTLSDILGNSISRPIEDGNTENYGRSKKSHSVVFDIEGGNSKRELEDFNANGAQSSVGKELEDERPSDIVEIESVEDNPGRDTDDLEEPLAEQGSSAQKKLRTLSRKISIHNLGKAIERSNKKLTTDTSYGFRFARGLDFASAFSFPLLYWVAVFVIFL